MEHKRRCACFVLCSVFKVETPVSVFRRSVPAARVGPGVYHLPETIVDPLIRTVNCKFIFLELGFAQLLITMEAMVKKYQQRFRKMREEMETWGQLQSLLTSQFRNASSVINRLQVLQDSNNYAGLAHLQEAVLLKQTESLHKLLLSMNNTMEQFHGVVLSLGRIHRDAKQMVKGGSSQLSFKQLQQRVGMKPSLADCVDGLMLLYDMHRSEYLLKISVVSALSQLTLKPSASDLGSLQQILIDQPNIPKEEVEFIFDIIFAEEIC